MIDLSAKILISEIDSRISNRNILRLSNEYTNSNDYLLWECLICKHEWKARIRKVCDVKKPSGCPNCFLLKNRHSKNYIDDWLSENTNIKLVDYNLDIDNKIGLRCLLCDYVFRMTWDNIRNGQRCRICSRNKASDKQRLSIEIVKNKVKNLNIILLDVSYDTVKNKKFNWQCKTCNNTFSMLLHNIMMGHGCDICNRKRGNKHPNWRGGFSKKDYPSEWTNKLKEQIRNRDQRKCQFSDCNVTDINSKRKLDVHHIDGNKKNCNKNNLVSLCNKHHSMIERDSEKWIEYFSKITGDM